MVRVTLFLICYNNIGDSDDFVIEQKQLDIWASLLGKIRVEGRSVEETAEAKIVIDTSVLHQRITTYSSLTDQNEIALFTDTYNQLEEKRRLNEENGAYRDAIFLVDIQVDGVEEVKNALFTTIGEEKYQEIVESSVSLDYVWYVAVLGSILIGLLMGVVYLRICSKRMKLEEKTCN